MGRKASDFRVQENRIRELRIRQGLNQKQLAEAVGVSQSVISDYETGTISPLLGTAFRLADVLECSVSDLFPRMRM